MIDGKLKHNPALILTRDKPILIVHPFRNFSQSHTHDSISNCIATLTLLQNKINIVITRYMDSKMNINDMGARLPNNDEPNVPIPFQIASNGAITSAFRVNNTILVLPILYTLVLVGTVGLLSTRSNRITTPL